MSKNENSVFGMIKLGLTLAAYAAVSCTVLAVVNNFTAKKIAENQASSAMAAMKTVFAQAESFEPVNDFEPSENGVITIQSMYLAKKGNAVIGGTVQVKGPTYDQGTLVLGVDKSGQVTGMRILELSDSPGFGLKANDPNFKLANGLTFYDQFTGKSSKDGFKAGENFDAISGATITSNGIADLMNAGAASLNKYLSNK